MASMLFTAVSSSGGVDVAQIHRHFFFREQAMVGAISYD